MKTLSILAVLLISSFHSVPAGTAPAGELAVARVTDEPPPLDCPMCGGNAALHEKRTKFFVRYTASLLIWTMADSRNWI